MKKLNCGAILLVVLGLLSLACVIGGPADPSRPDKEGGILALELGDGVQMELVWVDALMGWVGKYEVMNREYRRFKRDHNSGTFILPPNHEYRFKGESRWSLNEDRQPVVKVSYDGAVAFCEWLNRRGGLPKGYRVKLPDGNEWMTYAQCGDGRTYPWGNEWPPAYGNYNGQESSFSSTIDGYDDGFAVTCDVTLSGKNDWGIYGVGGNVSELTSEMRGQGRVHRGGSWSLTGSRDWLSCAYRLSSVAPKSCGYTIGFRVVVRNMGWDLLPPFKGVLEGTNPVRVRNPNPFAVAVGIRTGSKGNNFDVGANGDETVYIQNGRCDIYFVYSDNPEALYQGDSFTLSDNGLEITIVKVVNGNYGIRRVK